MHIDGICEIKNQVNETFDMNCIPKLWYQVKHFSRYSVLNVQMFTIQKIKSCIILLNIQGPKGNQDINTLAIIYEFYSSSSVFA